MADKGQAKERDILALAEGARATLIGRGWEVPGYWRWETTARGRRVRTYYDTSNPKRVQRIPARDAPTSFRLAPGDSAARSRPPDAGPSPAPIGQPTAYIRQPVAHVPTGLPPPTLESPFDIGAALAAFEARLLLAIRVDDALPDRERSLLRVRSLWPATTRAPGDYPTGIATPFRPTRAQVDIWLATMGAISGVDLDWRAWLALWMRARGASFRTIATEIGRNENRTRTIYRTAITECWRTSERHERREALSGSGRARVDGRGNAAGRLAPSLPQTSCPRPTAAAAGRSGAKGARR